jgi:O-antigen/teichoic acid export membrane protein
MKQRRTLTQLWDKLQQPDLLATLVRGASAALLTQTLGLGVTYLTQILFARWMGASGYGVLEYVTTLGTVLAFVAGLGLPGAVLRFISEYTVKQDWAHLRGVIWGSWWQTVAASLIIAISGTGLILWLDRSHSLEYSRSLILGLWAVPLLALMKLQLDMARAVQRIALAYAPSLVIYPLVLLGSTFVWVHLHQSLTSVSAIALSALSLLTVLTVQLVLFYQGLAPEIHQVQPAYAIGQWLRVSLPLLFIDGSFVVLNQTDTLMIGAMLGSTDVGIYSAAFKTAGWVNFILVAVNAIAAPLFASLYAQGDRQSLQRLVSVIARWMFYPALGVAIGLVIFAEPVLHLFGAEFIAAKWAMIALIAGQLVNVGAGSVGYLLIMTGHHNQCAQVIGISALLNFLLNLIGIPRFGILGAALATAVSMALWNIWLNALVVKYLGVNPSIVATLNPPQN